MSLRKPLVLVGGKKKNLPSGDTLQFPRSIEYSLSPEDATLTTGTKYTTWCKHAFRVLSILAEVTDASTSGLPTVDIKKNGTTIFTTKITIDATENRSTTAATAYVLTGAPTPVDFAVGDKLEFFVDVAGTGTKGLKVTLEVLPL